MKNIYTLVCFIFFSYVAYGQSLSANFSASPTEGCAPMIVNFTDLSLGNPTSWFWDFGNGSTSTLKNPSTSYFNPGSYTITLTVTNANGTHTTTRSNLITVYNNPVADFSVPVSGGCSPAVLQFNDQSSTQAGTTINSWKWNFGDGGTSTQQNPQHIYRNPGSYTVSLTITTDKGCTKTVTKPYIVNVTPGVIPTFSYVDPGDCSAPSTIYFQNNSTGPGTLSYSWNLGNGVTTTSQHASTTYNTNGTYRVRLFVSSSAGCSDSVIVNVPIGKANTDFTIPASICPKTSVQFVNNSTPRPIKSLWIFPDGTTDTFANGITVFPAAGTYNVTLINTYTACTDTLVKPVTVGAGPTINFTSADTGRCQPPLTVNFTNTSNGSSYLWNFGDGTTSTQTSPTHTYNALGDYDVTLIATTASGCIDTLKKTAFIKIRKPIITFPDLPAGGCIPFTFDFTANISSPDTAISYAWTFGDGGTSNLKNPSHTYTVAGTYNVGLTITTRTGCTETLTLADAIKVGPPPTADFTSNVTSACANPGIQFTNLSTGATQYLWEFSDGSSSTQANPLHTFIDTGWIDVTLNAINNGCTTRVVKPRYAYINPSISRFDYQPDCNNRLQYTFIDKSIQATSWVWDFGDGTTYTGQTPPVHTFPSMGTYSVSLSTSNGTCSYTLVRTITIADYTPDFTSTVTSGCKYFTPTITPSVPNAGLIKDYLWYFGTGDTLNFGHGVYGQYTYSQAGNYNVTLVTVDTFGCRYQITKPNFINVYGPRANFVSTTNNGCKGLTTTFIDSTRTDGTHPIVEWKWDFGDSTIQTYTSPPFQHTYDSVGHYDVKLVVKDALGCTDSITYRAFVKISTLKADFATAGATCPNAILGFINYSQSDLPYTSIWDVGDGTTYTTNNAGHAYTDTGWYDVKLKITDMVGCSDSITKVNAVQVNIPRANFTANNFTTYCIPFEAQFTNTSTFYNASNWDLSLGTSTQTNPSIYFTSRGTYPIKLVVTSPGGCKDSITQMLNVYDASDATLSYDPLTGCRPQNVDFIAFSQMFGRFIWDFGDGTVVDTTINTYSHVYDYFGSFVPKIILKQPDGCVVPLAGSNTIEIFGARAEFDITNKFFCDSGYIHIADSTTSRDNIIRYTWDFGDGNTSNLITPNHQYTSPGLYTVSLAVETANGCRDTMILDTPVKVVASPLISIGGEAVICEDSSITHLGIFDRPDTSAVSWQWQIPNGNTSNLQNPPPQQYTPGSYTVTAIATNSSGCKDTATLPLIIHALPQITLPVSITKLVGVPLTLPATYSTGTVSYLWTPSNTLDCATCPQPITTTKFNTTYTVVSTDSNGCKNTDKIDVIVICKGATIFLPNTFSPNGDGSNDMFYMRGVGLDRVKSLRVFNRWGEVVFEQRDFPVNNPSYGWNGLYKGKKQPDVYIYQVEVFCENGEIVRFEGNVALIL